MWGNSAPLLLPFLGLLAGTALGYIARRNFFCTLAALEQYWYGGNATGIRTWMLAALVAAAGVWLLSAAGIIDPRDSFYLDPGFSLLGAVVGGLTFGFGMALVGTCSFGALVRLGGGSLKSLMAILVLGLAALSTMRGILGYGREAFIDPFSLDLSFAASQSIPDIATAVTGPWFGLAATLVAFALPAVWLFSDPAFRSDRRALATGSAIGLIVVFGWVATGLLAGQSFDPVQVESASFVAPVGDLILQVTAYTGARPDYGVGMVPGVIIGAALAARLHDNVRWEACDDARELKRHISGAALMGFGGVLAMGCTIGQGVSAASLLAVSVPVTMASIALGARIGLAWLLEGGVLAAFRR